MKINANEIKVGMLIEYKDDLWEILKTQHVKPGKGPAYIQAKMKNVETGTIKVNRLNSSDKIDRREIQKREKR